MRAITRSSLRRSSQLCLAISLWSNITRKRSALLFHVCGFRELLQVSFALLLEPRSHDVAVSIISKLNRMRPKIVCKIIVKFRANLGKFVRKNEEAGCFVVVLNEATLMRPIILLYQTQSILACSRPQRTHLPTPTAVSSIHARFKCCPWTTNAVFRSGLSPQDRDK